MRVWALAVFLVALAVLGIGIESASLCTPYSDPVSRIRSQDEAFYVNSVQVMVRGGGWATPMFLDRVFLYKPPLLNWLAAVSVKLFGERLFALRLTSLLLGALGVALAYAWARRLRSPDAGLLAAALLLSNAVWHTFSRLCYTDVLTSVAVMAAVMFVAYDPLIVAWRTRIGFALGMTAAVMAKNFAGALPFLALMVFFAMSRTPWRAAVRSVLSTLAIAAALIAPWHVYQAVRHLQWFWTENVKFQMLAIGLNPPTSTVEPHAWFYAKRLFLSDPVLTLAALAGVVVLARRWKQRRSPHELMLVSWLLATVTALAAVQAKNMPYLTLLVPGLCVLAAASAPEFVFRHMRIALVLLGTVFAVKAVAGDTPWALRFGRAPAFAPVERLRWIQSLGRGNDLIIVAPDDAFYSATIGLSRVRYLFIDPSGDVARYGPHFRQLGITVNAGEYLSLDEHRAEYLARLHEWGLDSAKPIATAITAANVAEVARLIQSSPDADFDVPAELATQVQDGGRTVKAFRDRVVMLSAHSIAPEQPPRRLPERW